MEIAQPHTDFISPPTLGKNNLREWWRLVLWRSPKAVLSHTVLTGTVTPDESIAPIGAVLLKLAAAHTANIRLVLRVRSADGEGGSYPNVLVHADFFRPLGQEALETIMKTSSTP